MEDTAIFTVMYEFVEARLENHKDEEYKVVIKERHLPVEIESANR